MHFATESIINPKIDKLPKVCRMERSHIRILQRVQGISANASRAKVGLHYDHRYSGFLVRSDLLCFPSAVCLAVAKTKGWRAEKSTGNPGLPFARNRFSPGKYG